MNKGLAISLLLQLSIITVAVSQNRLLKKWDARFGGINDDDISIVYQTKDGGYLLGGSSYSGISGNKSQASQGNGDYWIVKIDANGHYMWDKRFGGLNWDAFNSMCATSDGGYLLAGWSVSGIGGNKTQTNRGSYDYWIVKIDSLGNQQWDKTFGGSADDILSSVKAAKDGGYILSGFSNSGISGDKTEDNRGSGSGTDDYWIVKVNSSGNKEWDKRYGGTDNETNFDIIQTPDGGFLTGGTSTSNIGGDKSQANLAGENFWIVKTDSAGNKLWDRVYGGTGGEELHSLLNTYDGGYLLGGDSYSGISGDKSQSYHGYWIIKIDQSGNKIWDKVFGPGAFNGVYFNSMSECNDHGYLLTGSSGFNIGGDKSEANLGPQQAWIIRTDSTGNKIWDKTIFSTGYDLGVSSIQTSDNCYLISVSSDAGIGGYKTQPNWESHDSLYDYWVVKFCDSIPLGIQEYEGSMHLRVFPNPTSDDLSISIQKDGIKAATYTLSNASGKLIYKSSDDNLAHSYTKILDLRGLPSGIYILEVTVDGERIVKKVIKE